MRRLAKWVAMITGAAVGVGKALVGAHARDGALAVRTAAAFEHTGGTTVLLTRPAMATAQTG
ncbi:hypothetical protein AAFN47_20555 [Hoeflea sp. CAU 1731]